MYYPVCVTTFIEQPLFTRQISELVDDEGYRRLQNELAWNPAKGPVVAGSGGLRKVRLGLPGRGKRGGARVLYLYFPEARTIIFYYAFTKGEMTDIPAWQMKGIRHEIQRIKKAFGAGDSA
jgi:hypothetical protein